MALTDERALWLALLTDPRVDRSQAKAALYRWAIVLQGRLADLAGLGADAIQERLPELDAPQAAAWHAALEGVEVAECTLGVWRSQGVDLMIRADAAYPENWVERLAERWLPYVMFYRGDLELLANSAVCVAGAETPTPAGSAAAEQLGARLGAGPTTLVGGYGQGVDRLALTAGLQAQGRAVVVLPVGFGCAGPILRAGQAAVEQGRRLDLSPFELEAAYTPALGRARSMLVTSMAEALVLVEPDLGPEQWPGYDGMRSKGGLVLLWQGSPGSQSSAWQEAGAIPFGDAQTVERTIATRLLASLDEDASADTEASPDPGAAPIGFEDADAAIRRLSETGRVPDKLARRLREAERRGWLGNGS